MQVSLAFPTVTTYFRIDAAQYDIEIVAAGQTDCTSDASAPVITNLAALTADAFYTLAFAGDSTVAGSDPSLTAYLFADDGARTDGNVNVRFLNAAPSLSGTTTVDFGTGAVGASTFVGLETSRRVRGGPDDGGRRRGHARHERLRRAARLRERDRVQRAHHDGRHHGHRPPPRPRSIATNTSATLVLINGKTGGTAKASFLVCQGDGRLPPPAPRRTARRSPSNPQSADGSPS